MEQVLTEQVKQLLQSTGLVLKKNEEIARLKGENFNMFRVLGVEHKEDELHSRFIAELLDPKGSHDQKTVFLKMFLEQVVDPLLSDSCKARLDESKAKVYREFYIEEVKIDGEYSTGGRIDIFITDGERHISVENKIWADEGEHQVTRYCNYKPESNLVLFLTLRGDKASTEKQYHPISYQEHILPWLESCQKYCADLPILRETIKQYIITIKRLTGCLTMQKMDENLKQLMLENIEAAQAIHSNYEPLFKETVDEFVQEVIKKIEGKEPVSSSPADWKIEIYNNDGGGLIIRNTKWIDLRTTPEGDHLMINWQNIYKQPYYGISAFQDHCDWKKIKEKLAGIKIEEYNQEWWPFRTDIKGTNFRNINELKKLCKEEERTELVKEIAYKLIELMKFCDDKLLSSENSNS